MLWHAYIDESGDRGWKQKPANTPLGVRAGSSRTFTMTAVIIPAGKQQAALLRWDDAATEVTSGRYVHWSNVKAPGARRHLLSVVGEMPVATISIVMCKWHLLKMSNMLTNPGYLYNWTARLLVERISQFGQANGGTVQMTFAQVKGHAPRLVTAYLEKLRSGPTDVNHPLYWANLERWPAFSTPRKRRMLQISDVVSGAVFTAFESDEWGYTDQTYLKMVKPLMWCRPVRRLYEEGLKVGPWPHEGCAAEHTWFSDFLRS